jgi:hypothetical protein
LEWVARSSAELLKPELKPHPSMLCIATLSDREGYIVVEIFVGILLFAPLNLIRQDLLF